MIAAWTTQSPEDLPNVAKALLDRLPSARIFGFWGNLGAGKTTFIKALCAYLGVEEAVTSPTFNLVNSYEAPSGDIHHFDFYRIKKEEEAFEIGIESYWDSGDYCFMEWPEQILSLLPEEMYVIEIEARENGERHIQLKLFEAFSL